MNNSQLIAVKPLNSSQTGWEGENNAASHDKTIAAVATATFLLE
jgi:hypothetical protein